VARNSEYFDLTRWKLCLPIDEDGGTTGTAFEILDLSGFEHSSYFYTAEDGAMVFRAITDGALTKGTTCDGMDWTRVRSTPVKPPEIVG
jgi:hypothetical protein